MTNFTLPTEFIPPDYSGGTIANMPATVARMLNVPFNGLPPLRETLWQPLTAGNVTRVIVLLIDAMGWNLFQTMREEFDGLFQRAVVADQITSIFPSTTAAALTSVWTGLAPAQHGLAGLNIFLTQYGVIGHVLNFSPAFISIPDALVDAGLEPQNFIRAPGFGQQLEQAGIPAYSFKGRDIVNSVLSQIHGRGVANQFGVASSADLFVQLRQFLEYTAGKPMYVYAYWPSIDKLSHYYGWHSASTRAELRALFNQLQQELLDALSPAARAGTVLCLMADHGQALMEKEQRVYLEDHPELERLLLMRSGEPRAAYLYARQGQAGRLHAYLQEQLPEAMVSLPAPAALANGLLGPEPHDPETAGRVGDVIAAMRQGYTLLYKREEEDADKLIGRHGGMTAAEMEVPWLGFRLDA